MTLIRGIIKDSGGNPLTGRLVVTANHDITDEATTPPSLITTEPRIFPINSGNININLKSSDAEQISYNFSFQVERPNAEADTGWQEIHSFNAQVPNVSSIDYVDLKPTDFTADQLDTGRYSIARILANNEDFAQKLRFNLNYKGNYSPTEIYTKHDVVAHEGSSFVYTNDNNRFGKEPPNYPISSDAYWQILGRRGFTGTGTAGNNQVYSDAWNGQMDAPTRNAVHDIISTLATRNNTFLVNSSATTPPLNAEGLEIATAQFVNHRNGEYWQASLGNSQNVTNNATFTEIEFNVDSTFNTNYNESAGVYITPYSGMFHLATHIRFGVSSSTSGVIYNRVIIQFRIRNGINETFYRVLDQENNYSNGFGSVFGGSGSVITRLNKDDLVTVQLYVSGTIEGFEYRLTPNLSDGRIFNSFSGVCLRRF